ncbi:MAG: TetR/AcrR family transcriptional regulator [Eggerthellaceae bacterium]|nr:TetR/AcrR family transcriptional regulator [Eggerthellaceae bacterium]
MSTKSDIMVAFASLLGELPVNSISTQAIFNRAGVSRRTFGRYFSGKEDIVIAQMKQDFEDPIRALLNLMPFEHMDNATKMLYARNFNALQANWPYYSAIVDGWGLPWLIRRYTNIALELERISVPLADGITPEEQDFARHFFAGIGGVAVQWWIESGFCVSAEDLADFVDTWAYGNRRLHLRSR